MTLLYCSAISILGDSWEIVGLSDDGKLDSRVYIQCAYLFTTSDGHRRIRVSTMCCGVSGLVANVFRSADCEALIGFMCRQAIKDLPKEPVSVIRDRLTMTCVEILAAYRRHCTDKPASGQLILPETLKHLPVRQPAMPTLSLGDSCFVVWCVPDESARDKRVSAPSSLGLHRLNPPRRLLHQRARPGRQPCYPRPRADGHAGRCQRPALVPTNGACVSTLITAPASTAAPVAAR